MTIPIKMKGKAAHPDHLTWMVTASDKEYGDQLLAYIRDRGPLAFKEECQRPGLLQFFEENWEDLK